MKRMKFLLSLTSALLFAACLYCPIFHAMPKFMERYDADQFAKPELKGKCGICHTREEGYGPLNALGKAFAENGYVINDKVRKQAANAFASGPNAGQPTAPVFAAKAFYDKSCAGCHGADGTGGESALNIPNFKDSKWQQRRTDQQIVDAITKGKGAMPPWKDKLSEEQIKAMAVFVRKLAE
ncbi:MAG: cytochrome c [Acidobacteria bacterium]|nr:cytochrome c [Acidobacteriota bacterium]MBI3424533.1 cytochrome c [Acidobacteriota bacterium]